MEQKEGKAERQLSKTWLLPAVLIPASLLLWIILFRSAITTGYTVLDDSTLNRFVLEDLRGGGSFWPIEIAYQENLQGGARYTPAFWIWRGLLFAVFGYSPAIHHTLHLTLTWIPLLAVPLYIGWRMGRIWLGLIPALTFFCFVDRSFSTLLWNLYDFSTYDPVSAGALGLAALAAFEALRARKRVGAVSWLGVHAVFALILAHTKETTAAGMLLAYLAVFAIAPFAGTAKRNRLLAIGAAGLLAVSVFWVGYFASGAAARSTDYTSAYHVSAQVILANAKFVFSEAWRLGDFFLPGLAALVFWRLVVCVRRRRISPEDMVFWWLLIAAVGFVGAVLPTETLPGLPRLLLLGVIAIGWCVAWGFWLAAGEFVSAGHSVRPRRRAAALAVGGALMFACVTAAPDRAREFNAGYQALLGAEWLAVRQAADWLDEYENEPVGVMWTSVESFYFGTAGHLANEGYHVDDRLVLIGPETLHRTREVPRFIVIGRGGGDAREAERFFRAAGYRVEPVMEPVRWRALTRGNLIGWIVGRRDSPFEVYTATPACLAVERPAAALVRPSAAPDSSGTLRTTKAD